MTFDPLVEVVMRFQAIVAALMLGACVNQPVATPVPVLIPGVSSVRLALLPPSREGDAALARGTLVVDGPCLYLVGADGTRWTPGFMTLDTRWDRGGLIVGSRRFLPGQRVALGGGEVKGAVANMAWVQSPDPSCDTSLIWVTVSIDPA